jgi:MYXO-CTERM domain-containing protein
MWIDGVNVLPKHVAANKYPGMKNYLSVGLYRNGHIGDPNLIWPAGTPAAGTHVYGTDGTPGVAYIDGFIAGTTRAAVEPPAPPVPPDATGNPTPSTPSANAAGFANGGGCASSGPQSAWLALPLIGLLAVRRRRRA